MKHEYNFIIQLGWGATGKTEFCKRLIKNENPERCLVIDACNEYNDLPEASDEFLSNPELKGIYRMSYLYIKKKDRFERFFKYVYGFSNGLLIIEVPPFFNDYSNAFKKIMGRADLVGKILCNRSHKVDIIMNLQGIKDFLHPKIVANTNILMLRKLPTSVYLSRKIIPSENLLETLIQSERIIRDTYLDCVTINLTD